MLNMFSMKLDYLRVSATLTATARRFVIPPSSFHVIYNILFKIDYSLYI